jgi:hypothetical protein
MAELVPASFADLVTRLHSEPAAKDALFELSRRNWYFPRPDDPDMSVEFHGQRAGNPSDRRGSAHADGQNLPPVTRRRHRTQDGSEGRPASAGRASTHQRRNNIEWSQERGAERANIAARDADSDAAGGRARAKASDERPATGFLISASAMTWPASAATKYANFSKVCATPRR